jgi:maltose alpha-D-glucosyltransferase/alpha-amylase
VWADKKPANASKGMVFPGVQKSTWTHDKEAKAWYFHRFYDFQPDLNTSNPRVQAEILKIMGFWIQLGVSGFRMDAVPFVIATKGAKVRTPVEQYDMLRSFPGIPAMAARQRHHPCRSLCAARNRHGVSR